MTSFYVGYYLSDGRTVVAWGVAEFLAANMSSAPRALDAQTDEICERVRATLPLKYGGPAFSVQFDDRIAWSRGEVRGNHEAERLDDVLVKQ